MKTEQTIIQPPDLEGMQTDVSAASLASKVLTVTLRNGAAVKFYGSPNGTNFANHFLLKNGEEKLFHIKPGDAETVVNEFRRAVAEGFVYLETYK